MDRHDRHPGPLARSALSAALGEAGTGRRCAHGGSEPAPTVRVGVDIASIEAVRASVERFGDRYTRRCFTEHEIETSSGSPAVQAASLAARFAAKEATVKALAAGGESFDWRSVEVRRRPSGGCAVVLHGSLAELAAREGVSQLAVALTHEGAVAAAVVVAVCEATEGSGGRQPSGRKSGPRCGPEKES